MENKGEKSYQPKVIHSQKFAPDKIRKSKFPSTGTK
jgi:hypothetical protein